MKNNNKRMTLRTLRKTSLGCKTGMKLEDLHTYQRSRGRVCTVSFLK